jgi:hypothetical protein
MIPHRSNAVVPAALRLGEVVRDAHQRQVQRSPPARNLRVHRTRRHFEIGGCTTTATSSSDAFGVREDDESLHYRCRRHVFRRRDPLLLDPDLHSALAGTTETIVRQTGADVDRFGHRPLLSKPKHDLSLLERTNLDGDALFNACVAPS